MISRFKIGLGLPVLIRMGKSFCLNRIVCNNINIDLFKREHSTIFRSNTVTPVGKDKYFVVHGHVDDNKMAGLTLKLGDEIRKIKMEFNMYRNKNENMDSLLRFIMLRIQSRIVSNRQHYNTNTIPVSVSLMNIKNGSVLHGSTESKSDNVQHDDLTCSRCLIDEASNHVLIIDGQVYPVELDPPQVQHVKLPRVYMVGFLLYALELNLINCQEEDCIFEWYRSKETYESLHDVAINDPSFEYMGRGNFIKPAESDVNRAIKLVVTPATKTRQGISVSCNKLSYVAIHPEDFPFQRRHQHTTKTAGENRIRVMTYNIMASCYANTDMTKSRTPSSIPDYALSMYYRKHILIQEILGYNSDIMCIQEIEKVIFHEDFHPIFSRQGFEGSYAIKEYNGVEGCAMFYRKDKFTLLGIYKFCLSDELRENILLKELWEKVQLNEAFCKVVKSNGTVLQILVLQCKENATRILVVATTHLPANPQRRNVKALLASICMTLLQDMISLYEEQFPNGDVGLIFTGDFNSRPSLMTHRFMMDKIISHDDLDWSYDPKTEVNGISLSHDMDLKSACGTPLYTNYVLEFNGCLDYIYYQADKFAVKQVIPMPTHEEVTANEALPSTVFPSDHIALIADLEIVNTR